MKDFKEIIAEQIAKATNIDLVIIRPPLVYGNGSKGNFASLINWVQKGVPLPLAAATNRRSMVAVENLSSFITLFFLSNMQKFNYNNLFNLIFKIIIRKLLFFISYLNIIIFLFLSLN